ncbi:MAG TPA: TRAP transporter small permease subunit [Candidatus Deferrimicrobiaceae bacterium]|nr:TRAP transporter small permease subunit [Candidatus Deferrimicrobiaceae bacterium]
MATPVRGNLNARGGLSPALIGLIRAIDRFSDWSGQIVCWLIIPLVGSLTYEVFARYLFGAPTEWAYDVSYMLYGTLFMLGAAYALFRGGHIRTDMLYQNWSPRRQGTVDAVCYLFLFFPAMLFLLWMGGVEAWHAWEIGERSDQSPWRPILYPFKAVIPVTALMLLAQGLSEFLKSVYAMRTNRLYAKRETIEI